MNPNYNNIVLQLKNLSVGYDKSKPVLENINFSFSAGNLIGLVAKNGAGKSTLIKTICGAVTALDGSILIDDKKIDQITKNELSKKIALVLTEKPKLSGFTVHELVSLGRHPHSGFFGKLNSADKKIISASISMCGIEQLQNNYCDELSDGEFQKVMLARAIAQDTPVIFLDEPTAFLDFPSKVNIMRLLKYLTETQNKCIIIASHDLDLLLNNSDQIMILKNRFNHALYDSKSIDFEQLTNELTNS